MPLRHHFHSPLADQRSWEELHGAWPGVIPRLEHTLTAGILFRCPRPPCGTAVEIDIATFENDHTEQVGTSAGRVPMAFLEAPTILLKNTDIQTPPEYEVLVYDERHARRLVAAVEIVSPRNKDRATARVVFCVEVSYPAPARCLRGDC